ncbi:hypothetical protein DH2020_011628 [Rehmannia glutinosa]|uniref:Uncharacterized protein n=1 Tax=Rehmannia glutinosa TaxID=99300 RepID=A0ABR0XDV1_REHGL
MELTQSSTSILARVPKKSRRKESKKHRRVHDSVSSYSDDKSLNSEHTSSPISKSDHKKRINKNKKLRRDYSLSSSSDDHSVSSDSDTSSTYDNGNKRKKAKRSSLSLKSTKKRARKRSAKPNDNRDTHIVKKRKRLSRDHVSKQIKKSSKKKPKKHLRSSSSSDSESYSTSQSTSSSSTADCKRKRNKVILDNERERPRGRESYKARKKRKVRSPSYSSCDEDSKHSISVGHRDGALSPVKNPRRLKSVIAIADQRYDEGENIWEKDPQKEEIVYDRNDYPSPKSLDSNEGGNKMELDNHYYGASSKRIGVENVAGEEGKSEGDQDNGSGDHHSEAANTNNIEKGKEMDTSILESILRQKALENLKKFKWRLQTGPRSTNPKTNNESDVNKSSAQRVDDVQNESTEQGSFNARETNKNSGPSLQRNLSQLTEVKKLPDGKYVEKEPEMAAQTVEHTFNGTAVLGCLEGDKNGCSNAGLAKPSDTSLGAGTTNACSSSMAKPSSSVGPMSEEHSLEQGNEAKDGSQFKEKTMFVMRGGEMVQVSYKVYIPKKAPALARRQLKR